MRESQHGEQSEDTTEVQTHYAWHPVNLDIDRRSGNAATNNITISGSASDTIDGQNTVILESPFASIQLYCNGENKFFIC